MNQHSKRVEEAYNATRTKDVNSATIERLKITWEAHVLFEELPQSLQLGEGFYYILDNISLPIAPHDLLLGRMAEEVPDEEGEALLDRTAEEWNRAVPSWMPDGGHECFDWERLVSLGLCGLEAFAQDELDRRVARKESGDHLDFLRGVIRLYQAIRNYARRYAHAAGESGLHDQAINCAAAAEKAPSTFAEAMQLMLIVGHVYSTVGAVNSTLTFGRMDEILLDFYRADLVGGRLTRDDAGDIIEDFYCKTNLILGRGEHQMSGRSEKASGWLRNQAYDTPLYVVIGGYLPDGTTCCNELTELFVERIEPGLENPVIIFRYTKSTPDHLWSMVCDKMRDNASMMVYNDEAVVPAMVHSGIEKQDAAKYVMYGCNWPAIPGVQAGQGGYGNVLPEHILKSIMEGTEPESIDEIYTRFCASFRADMADRLHRFREARANWEKAGPGTLRIDDCFQNGNIALARSWRLGTAKYPTFLTSVRHIGTAADCMAAVDDLVFKSGTVTMRELRKALAEDFAGNERLRRMCLNAPKFGQSDNSADGHGQRILNTVTAELDDASRFGEPDQMIIFRSLTTDMAHMREGERLEATPDGRRAGKPLSDNSSPNPGSCRNGITAMFGSLAKLPFNRFNSGALNVRLQKGMVTGEGGLKRLEAVLRAYFTMGGLQVQLSVADTEELLKAQKDPEAHRDLIVRITGYSAVFVDMCKAAQDEIIRRPAMDCA